MGERRRDGRRLEELWAGPFGDAYAERNANAAAGRETFWRQLLALATPGAILEVGCNIGANLHWIVSLLPAARVAAVDVNETVVEHVRAEYKSVDTRRASATKLPFPDRSFDLVFTTGVLIHLPDETLTAAMDEIVRCSARYVLCGEYYAEQTIDVKYHGLHGALFKRDYGRLYAERFPELQEVQRGFLPRTVGGWDDVTWWLFERR